MLKDTVGLPNLRPKKSRSGALSAVRLPRQTVGRKFAGRKSSRGARLRGSKRRFSCGQLMHTSSRTLLKMRISNSAKYSVTKRFSMKANKCREERRGVRYSFK